MSTAINGDLGARAFADTAQMDWTPSPSGTVWRKRVHLVGPPESGQVTSIVRYEPHSTFPGHDHPDGEEILVLDGVFSDDQGDWPSGTYLLNPEGFRHAPRSTPGCTLFVKLRQYPGRKRLRLAIATSDLEWQPSELDGVVQKLLYKQGGFSDSTRLERWAAGTRSLVAFPEGAEMLVLAGELEIDSRDYPRGCWARFPARDECRMGSGAGCTLYVKRGGLAYLRSGGA